MKLKRLTWNCRLWKMLFQNVFASQQTFLVTYTAKEIWKLNQIQPSKIYDKPMCWFNHVTRSFYMELNFKEVFFLCKFSHLNNHRINREKFNLIINSYVVLKWNAYKFLRLILNTTWKKKVNFLVTL